MILAFIVQHSTLSRHESNQCETAHEVLFAKGGGISMKKIIWKAGFPAWFVWFVCFVFCY